MNNEQNTPPTPRTDAQINGKPCTRFSILAGDALRDALVPADFARTLERELAAKDREIEAHRNDKKKLHTECTDLTARAEKAGAERDQLRAEVERLKAAFSDPVVLRTNVLRHLPGYDLMSEEYVGRLTRAGEEADQLRAALAAAKNTLREYLPQLAHEWDWKRNSTPANNREMAELDAAIDQARSHLPETGKDTP